MGNRCIGPQAYALCNKEEINVRISSYVGHFEVEVVEALC
jgi:hypothetical protein